METPPETPEKPAAPRKSIFATLKGLGFTIVVLAVLWIALRYVLTPLVLPEGMPEKSEAAPVVTNTYEERIKALEDKVAALEEAKPTETTNIAPLEERITALEAKPEQAPAAAISNEEVTSLKSDVEKLKTENRTTLRSIIAVGQLRDAIRGGYPFTNELNTITALRPDLKEITDALQPLAATGVATHEQLKQQFAGAISPALAPDAKTKSFAGNLRSLVKVRKVGQEQKGADDQAIIARAEARLEGGFTSMAINEIENLSPPAARNFEAWVKRANDHLLADAAGQRLEADITKDVQ